MSPAAQPNIRGVEPRAAAVEVNNQFIIAHLVDGRTICVPISWSWRLSDATPGLDHGFHAGSEKVL